MKKGDARRGELLAAAEKLFYTKGYENTSVQDILDAVGFSKGGFTIILTVNWPCWKRFASSGRKNSAKAPCRPLGNRI
ncbi:MAG: TetR/AcrR family transcriptional regulator [Christensenellales bacterium]